MSSNLSEKIQAIRKLVFGSELKFEAKKLQDGTEVEVSAIEVGGSVQIGGVAAAAGSYVLEDGTVLLVDESSRITEVTAPVAPAALESQALADGSSIEVSALEVGGDVMVSGVASGDATYELADGRKIVVDESGKIVEIKEKEVPVQMSAEDLDTPEKLMEATQKFATGTPEERMANLEVVCKALMEYCFGWQIREAQNKALTEQAINTYKSNFEAAQAKIEKQDGVIKEMLALCEEMAQAPQADPPATKRVSSFSKVETKNESFNKFAEAAKKLKEVNN